MNIKYTPPLLLPFPSSSFTLFAEKEVKLKNVLIYGTAYIGFGTYMNDGDIRSNVEIGRYCSIGRNVSIGLGHHDYTHITTSSWFDKKGVLPKNNTLKLTDIKGRRVLIGNDVWIGDGVKICNGVVIGDGAVIGAGSIVTKDVPPYSIVAGIPAKVLKHRFSDRVHDLMLKIKWWEYDPEEITKFFANIYKEGQGIESLERNITNMPQLKFPISYSKMTNTLL